MKVATGRMSSLKLDIVSAAFAGEEKTHLPLVCVVTQDTAHKEYLLATLSSYFRVAVYTDVDEVMEAELENLPVVILLDHQGQNDKNYIRFLRHARRLKKDTPGLLSTTLELESLGFRGDEQNVPSKDLIWPLERQTLLETLSWIIGKKAEKAWRDLPREIGQPLSMTVKEYQGISDAIAKGEPIDCTEAAESCKPLRLAVESGHHHELLQAVQGHHDYTYVHSMRVATLLTLFGHGLGMKGDELLILSTGGLIHDVGKLVTPEEILSKPGKLSDEEWVIMRDHVTRSSELLANASDVTKGAMIITEQHHEKIDGSGYPLGLKGGQLNELARMSAIVDIFGALTDKRSYKPAFPQEKAFSILKEMDKQIDQKLLNTFRAIFESEQSNGA
jgi:HD-GYP domain-containing protein (c-di-GMP phosphodiesterase class II)